MFSRRIPILNVGGLAQKIVVFILVYYTVIPRWIKILVWLLWLMYMFGLTIGREMIYTPIHQEEEENKLAT